MSKQQGGYIDDALIKLLDNTNINNDYSAKDILNIIRLLDSKKDTIERDDIFKVLNNYMPLPIFIEFLSKYNINNFLLINQENYILIDKRSSEGKQYIFKLSNDYNIKEVVPESIPVLYNNNINIFNLSPRIINSRISFIDNFFTGTVPLINENNYPYFNILKNNLYSQDGALYNRNMNCILAFIFMNRLDDVLNLIDTLDDNILLDNNNYYDDKTKSKLDPLTSADFDHCKSENMIECLLVYANINNPKKITEAHLNDVKIINYNLKNILKNKKDASPDDYNILIKIISIVIKYINHSYRIEQNLISGYNYCTYINQLKELNQTLIRDEDETETLSDEKYNKRKLAYDKGKVELMMKFIQKSLVQIKQKLIFELSYFIYLAYKTNKETNNELQISQQLLLDYFYGVTSNIIPYLPINPRNNVININKSADDNTFFNINDPAILSGKSATDQLFYNNLPKKYEIILPQSQTIFTDESGVKHTYVDCGETTLLNLFNYILIKADNTFDTSKLSDPKILGFYEKYKNINQILTTDLQQVKNDWGLVIQNRPELIEKYMYLDKKYNFSPSLRNITFLCNLLHNNHNKKLPLLKIIEYINPNVRLTKAPDQYVSDMFKIDNLIISLSAEHSTSSVSSKFYTVYDEFEKILINYDYSIINIHLLFKIGNYKFDITECKSYDVMKYLFKYYFTDNTKKIRNQYKFELLKYLEVENIVINDDHLDIENDEILNFIYDEIIKTNNIFEISKFLEISLSDLLDEKHEYRHMSPEFKKYPINLLKKIYDHKIKNLRFFDVDDDNKSYILLFYVEQSNSSKKETNECLKNIITELRKLHKYPEYIQKLDERNTKLFEIYGREYNEYDIYASDDDEDDETYYGMFDIIREYKNDSGIPVENKSNIKDDINKLYHSNRVYEFNIKQIQRTKTFFIDNIVPLHSYIDDDAIQERIRLEKLKYKLASLEIKTEAEGIINTIDAKIIALPRENTEIIQKIDSNVIRIKDMLKEINELYVNINENTYDKYVTIYELSQNIKKIIKKINADISNINKPVLKKPIPVLAKSSWDDDELFGGYYNKSLKYYNKLHLI